MFSLSLRQLVSAIGLLVAVTTGLSIPIGYATTSYFAETDRRAFEARLNASRVARYIYQHGAMWPFHRVRLAEIIELSGDDRDGVTQRIFTAGGKLVLDEGVALATPTSTRSAPILVSGEAVGRIEVEMSIRPILLKTALVACLSLVLGLLAYFGVRILPLRVLDRTMAQLAHRERALSTTSARLEAALSNMAQGLVMFDAEHRLVVCNRRYMEIYGLPPDKVKLGCTLRDLFALFVSLGQLSPEDAERAYADRQVLVSEQKPATARRQLTGGRIIHIVHQPMGDGGYVATHEDITERERTEAQIAHMAHHDALTGLPNRVLFHEEMVRALTRVQRGEKLAVLCLDLDHFKAVNDTLGHPLGDVLLQAVGDRLRGCVRETDTAARLGGDEFAIIQVAVEQPEHSIALAERIIETISAPYDLDGHHVVIGTSIGIAIAPVDASEPDQLLKSADMALYRAKMDGRGTFRFFEREMDAKMQARRALEVDLRQGLPNGEFEVYYQPLVNLETDQVSGFEALLRWTHPKRGRLSPAEFIPLAEEIGLITQLGAWVLKQACAEAMTWPEDVKVAVNISAVQFRSRTLVLDVIAALGASGLPGHRLELEITESVVMQDTEATLATLHQLRELGVRISMDDFGTGYSSLSYLRKFPFDKIKIDQSFVHDLDESLAIIRAVTGLSTGLGMSTTAEGVETKAQLERLRLEGCTEVQGYFFSQPRPASEVAGLLTSVPGKSRAAA